MTCHLAGLSSAVRTNLPHGLEGSPMVVRLGNRGIRPHPITKTISESLHWQR